MGFTINFNVGVVQKVIQYQSVSDKDDRDQEKKKDKKPETVVEDNGEEKKNKEKKPVSTAEDNGEEKKKKKKKEKKTVSTAVFAVHCGRCIRKVCEVLAKIKGIRDTVIDVENNHVTVKGEMDMMALAEYLGRKLKKAVVIVQVNDNGGGAGAGEEEKEGDKNGASEFGLCPYGCPYPKGYSNLRPNGYGSGYLAAAEQMFSDENPNACSVM